jgi:hypothetical protein
MNPESIMGTIAANIESYLGTVISDLQVVDHMEVNPTPPSIDIYPAEPFQAPFKMRGNNDMRFTVRARVHTADHEAGQSVLLGLMNDTGANSLGQAIIQDRSLGGQCGGLVVDEVGGFQLMLDIGGEGSYMGAVWTVRVVP